MVYGEALNNLFYESEPVKEFRKKYKLTKVGGTKPLLQSLLKAYKEFGGKEIAEYRDTGIPAAVPDVRIERVSTADRRLFRRENYPTEGGLAGSTGIPERVLRKGDFAIDLIYRRVKVSEFLVRFDLNHPLVRAYRERAVCVVNSFRSELAQKKAIFDLLTDETITAGFPAAERKAIREFIPWTRVVSGEQDDLSTTRQWISRISF